MLAVLILGFGAGLFLAPLWADGAWPWLLTPLTARAIGAWLIGLGVAAAHARVIDDLASIRPLAVTGVLFGVLQAVALLRHGDELDWGNPSSWVYVIVLAVLAGAGARALWVGRSDHAAAPALRQAT